MSQLLDESGELELLKLVLFPLASSLSCLSLVVVPSIMSLTSIESELLRLRARSWMCKGGSLGYPR